MQLKYSTVFHFLIAKNEEMRTGLTNHCIDQILVKDVSHTSHCRPFLQDFCPLRSLGQLCLRRQLRPCSLQHQSRSHPNQLLYYKYPPALEITKRLSCWPLSTSLTLGRLSMSSRYSQCCPCTLTATLSHVMLLPY